MTIPVSLSALVITGLFGLAQGALIKQHQAFELARRIAFADVDHEEATILSRSLYPTAVITKVQTEQGCVIEVAATENVHPVGFLSSVLYSIRETVVCENPQ